jgi:hypothetical protein
LPKKVKKIAYSQFRKLYQEPEESQSKMLELLKNETIDEASIQESEISSEDGKGENSASDQELQSLKADFEQKILEQ